MHGFRRTAVFLSAVRSTAADSRFALPEIEAIQAQRASNPEGCCYIPNMIALLLAMATGEAALPVDLSKGAHLYGSCQAAVRLNDDPNSSQAKAELASSTYCFGYLGGYIDGLNVLTEQVCVRGASLETIARVYVIYMQKNPKLMDEGRVLGLLLSLKDSYGCPKPPAAKAGAQQR